MYSGCSIYPARCDSPPPADGGSVNAQDLTVDLNRRVSQHSVFRITVHCNPKIVGISQYTGWWYRDYYPSQQEDDDQSKPFNDRQKPLNFVKWYTPYLRIGVYVQEHTGDPSNYTVSKDWTIPHSHNEIFSPHTTSKYKPFNPWELYINSVYLTEKNTHIHEGLHFPQSHTFLYVPTDQHVTRLKIHPTIEFMGLALELQQQPNNLSIIVDEIPAE